MRSDGKDSMSMLIEDVDAAAGNNACRYFNAQLGPCKECPARDDPRPCLMCALDDIARRLHALMPHDRKGVEIKPGDTIEMTGHKKQVCITDVLTLPAIVKDEGACVETFAMPWLWSVVQPDSWERLEEDATMLPHDYLTAKDTSDKRYGTEALTAMSADLVRRAKRLAGVGQ